MKTAGSYAADAGSGCRSSTAGAYGDWVAHCTFVVNTNRLDFYGSHVNIMENANGKAPTNMRSTIAACDPARKCCAAVLASNVFLLSILLQADFGVSSHLRIRKIEVRSQLFCCPCQEVALSGSKIRFGVMNEAIEVN